ncbi:DUF732 domain-containing protein [Mycobacteroides chelonae]|uniref:DUF732 domain-containing protein n=1 Tax=Mycobacteroides chelonae TaxID=1774 RepID=UPI0008AA2925|nr:DUF732 domain-containing protein [Mycobacteroides chelonae]OHU29005.1 hypothetical protein BKG78_23295 [Mycobacteroides chelonae]
MTRWRAITAAMCAAFLLPGCGGSTTTTVTETVITKTVAATTTTPSLTLQEINELSFFGVLDQYSIPYADKAETLRQAQALCLYYETTGSPFELGAMQILRSNPTYTAEQAGTFAGAATAAFCEKYRPKQ